MDLYRALNCPVELKNWKSEGGDPCWSAMFPFSCSKLQGFSLPGNLGDQLLSLQHLKNLDLSHIKFSGDLLASFRALNNLTRLYLQSNEFSGSVIFLANLHPHDLNLACNYDTRSIPPSASSMKHLRHLIGGSQFDRGVNYPPWKFPTDVVPNEQNMSSLQTTESTAIEQHPSHKAAYNRKRRPGSGGTVIMAVGAVLSVIGAAVFITVWFQRSQRQSLDSIRGSISSLQSFTISAPQGITSSLAAQYYSTDSSSSDSPPLVSPWQLSSAPTRTLKMSKRRSFSKKFKLPICAKLYTVAELQLATNNFSPANLLGEGTFGSVYRAQSAHFPDEQASEMAIADSVYVAPEHVKHGSGNPKADIYSFCVLLLELLTGRQPVDSSKPKGEQSLVERASSKLHDSESLLEMVGPTIKRTISSRTISSYADIISQCIQPQKEFRPQMSEVVQSLVLVLQKSGQEKPKSGKDRTAAEGTRIEPCEKFFRSTNSHFFASTTASCYSI